MLLTKLKTAEARLAYAQRAIDHGWSRNVLALHIEQRTLEREGKALTNFEQRLPGPQSDLARESLKDPYRLDFLSMATDANEREGDRGCARPAHHALSARVRRRLCLCWDR